MGKLSISTLLAFGVIALAIKYSYDWGYSNAADHAFDRNRLSRLKDRVDALNPEGAE